MSITDYGETFLLEKLPATMYVKLHTGDPGEAGSLNAASESTRKAVTFAAAVANTRASSSAAEWVNVSTNETYSHVSLWELAFGGSCLWTMALAESKAVSKEDNFTLKAGQLSVSLD